MELVIMQTESLLCSQELTVLEYCPCGEGQLRVMLGFAGVQRTSLSYRRAVGREGKQSFNDFLAAHCSWFSVTVTIFCHKPSPESREYEHLVKLHDEKSESHHTDNQSSDVS